MLVFLTTCGRTSSPRFGNDLQLLLQIFPETGGLRGSCPIVEERYSQKRRGESAKSGCSVGRVGGQKVGLLKSGCLRRLRWSSRLLTFRGRFLSWKRSTVSCRSIRRISNQFCFISYQNYVPSAIPFYYFKGGRREEGSAVRGCRRGVLVRVVLFIIMRSEDEDNLKMLREINNNTVTEIEHDLEPVPPQPTPHAHPLPDQHPHDHAHHGHSHSHHSHSHSPGKPSNKKLGKKNYLIIMYTTFTCLSCWYLETQHFNPYLGDFRALLMTYLTWLDVVMCLWSYFQTIRTSPAVEKMPLRDRNPYNLPLKECPSCNYMKPPRVSHCSTCGKCIYKLDHHCIWTQTCIGFANQRSFYLFCFYMSVGVVQFWYSTARMASLLLDGCNFFGAFEPGVYVLWGITCFSAGFVGMMIIGLAVGHTMMIMTNFTTLDSIKSKRTCPIPFLEFRKSQLDPKSINAWDRGEVQNLKSLFGTNILTFWMPLAREIDNEFLFEAMTPTITPITPTQLMRVPSAEIKRQLAGQTFKINDQTVVL